MKITAIVCFVVYMCATLLSTGALAAPLAAPVPEANPAPLAIPEANPWRPRGGRGIYRREAEAEAFHPREGDPLYVITKRNAEPEANPWRPRGGRGIYRREAVPFHPREGDGLYYISKRSAEPGRFRAVGTFKY